MSRLFLGPREINFINDITKEVIKDVAGQKIYYYPISDLKTKMHAMNNESPEKIFDNPIILDALVSSPVPETKAGKIGFEQSWTIEAFLQSRDLYAKNVNVSVGDFFTFGQQIFEIITFSYMRNIYGQAEYYDGYKIEGLNVRDSQFKIKVLGPTSEHYLEKDAVQQTFVQQRGFTTNSEGPTGDVRDLQKSGVLDAPISGPAEVSPRGDPDHVGPAFYDET